jgi:DNA-binding MarR family transcriptional regulator
MLGLLDSVERDGARSQRVLASELGIALGLVNAYLKRCVKKGLVKAKQAPARRYIYYLTSHGFAEKSRLTVEYLSGSFSFFREAKSDCIRLFESAKANGLSRFVLTGRSDLAEIAVICALDMGAVIVAVHDIGGGASPFVGRPVFASFEEIPDSFDAIIVTDLTAPAESYSRAVACFGEGQVLVPRLLRMRAGDVAGVPQ